MASSIAATILTAFDTQTLQVFYQLALALFLGALIGFERQLAHKVAGMRTYALVSLGSCLFTYLSKYGFPEFLASGSGFNPAMIAAQVVTGIGFLGAGLIIFQSRQLRGLTTAAGLWVAAAIGMAVGLEFYAVAIFTALLTLFVFVVLWIFEQQLVRHVGDEQE